MRGCCIVGEAKGLRRNPSPAAFGDTLSLWEREARYANAFFKNSTVRDHARSAAGLL